MPKRTVQIGDSFIRANNQKTTWVVERIFEYPDIPPHARLIENETRRIVTVAVSVLVEGAQFKRVPRKEEPAG